MLDRPEGDAAPVVEHTGSDQRSGRTNAHAGITTAAGLLQWAIRFELRGGHDLGQQYVRANSRNEQVAVLAQPADAGASRRRAIQHPAVVDVGLGDVATLAQHRQERLHPVD